MEIVPLRTSGLVVPAKYIGLFLLSVAGIASAGWILSLADPRLAIGIIGAFIGSFAVLATARFCPFSLVFLVGLTHLIFYPLAAFLNLLLDTPAVRPDLWDSVDLAMAGGAIGCLSLAFGSCLSRFVPARRTEFPDFTPPRVTGLISIAIQIIVASLLFALGLYYHSSVTGEYAFHNIHYVNALVIISWAGHAGLFLQVYRYSKTGKTYDALLATGVIIFTIALFAPSGSRTQTFQFLPLLAFLFLTIEKRILVKYAILGIVVVMGLLLTVGMGIYRDLSGLGILSEKEGIAPIFDMFRSGMESLDESEALVVQRLSDFVATGRIIDYTPGAIPCRGFKDVGDWWQMLLPGVFRPDIELAMDGARETVKYGVSTSTEFGSSPVMIIGDLYGRGGWFALVLGMGMIGFALGTLDRRILFRTSPFTVIFFALFGRHIFSLVSSSTLNVFVMLTRELVLMLLLTYALNRAVAFIDRKTFVW